MSAADYRKAIWSVLKEAGFKATGRHQEWRRERDGFAEEVNLQGTRVAPEVTVNFYLRHEGAYTRVRAIAGSGGVGSNFPIYLRLGTFLSPYDKWWGRDDPDGPGEVAELIRTKLLPYFALMETADPYIEAISKQYVGPRWPVVKAVLELATLLHERGDIEKARHILFNPPERMDEGDRARLAAVRRALFPDDAA